MSQSRGEGLRRGGPHGAYPITPNMLWSVEGVSVHEVAGRWGCSSRTIYRHAKRLGFRRERGAVGRPALYRTAPCRDCGEVVRRATLSLDRRCESCRYGDRIDWLALEREASRRRLQAEVG